MGGARQPEQRRRRGFQRAAQVVERQIAKAGETRGFAVSRLLTHWAEIVGAEVAAAARPVKVSYARGGFGATLTLLVAGAQAPLIQSALPRIRERVNTCYGYNAISRIRLTQTAATGFAEQQEQFDPAPAQTPPDPAASRAAAAAAEGVSDTDLRRALEALGEKVLTRNRPTTRQSK